MQRKHSTLNRLRQQLRKKKESLADQFEFKMYMIFHFKEQPKKKPCAVFEVAEVVPVMTNNYEDSILKGVKEEAYSYESTKELLDKDVVQLHAPRWQSMRKDVIGCTTEMDFFLFPRNDIDRVECLLFSRWKDGSNEPFRQLKAGFSFFHDDYKKQLLKLMTNKDKDKAGLIINNPSQSVFFFVDRQHMESAKNNTVVFKLSSVCLYLPQDQLTLWDMGSCEEVLASYL